jgi:hypothetical protein
VNGLGFKFPVFRHDALSGVVNGWMIGQ